MATRLAVLAVVLLAGACEGQYEPLPPGDESGSMGEGTEGPPGPDAAVGSTGGAGTAAPGSDAAAECEAAVTAPGAGHHNAGLACMTCHDGNGEAPRWTIAGTVFTTANSSTAVVGATILVLDAGGTEHALVTRTNGNFWTDLPIAFPVEVKASRCPSTRAMVASVNQAGGNCNSQGCHSAGLRIFLP